MKPTALKTTTFAILTLLLLTTLPAFASGPNSPSPNAAGAFPEDPLLVTETVRCRVVDVRDDGTILVNDDGTIKRLNYDETTSVWAQKKKNWDGRKKLAIADIAVGQELKVTVQPASGKVLKVKVKKPEEGTQG